MVIVLMKHHKSELKNDVTLDGNIDWLIKKLKLGLD